MNIGNNTHRVKVFKFLVRNCKFVFFLCRHALSSLCLAVEEMEVAVSTLWSSYVCACAVYLVLLYSAAFYTETQSSPWS